MGLTWMLRKSSSILGHSTHAHSTILPSGGRIASGKGLGASVARAAGSGELHVQWIVRLGGGNCGTEEVRRRSSKKRKKWRGRQTRDDRKKRGGEDGGRGGREKEKERGAGGAISGRCR